MDIRPEPAIFNKPHNDWPWPLKWVPRRWTSFYLGRKAPVKVLGSQREMVVAPGFDRAGPKPIPEIGAWQLTRFPGLWAPFRWIPLYFAVTFKSGRHFRLGLFRWDDVDGYFTVFTIATRKFTGHPIQDTSAK